MWRSRGVSTRPDVSAQPVSYMSPSNRQANRAAHKTELEPQKRCYLPCHLLQGVACPTAFTDLRQVIIVRQLLYVHLDGVAVGACEFLDFFDLDFAMRFGELQYLVRKGRTQTLRESVSYCRPGFPASRSTTLREFKSAARLT